ncbi:MAG: hypothetical protein ACRC2B_24150 [Rubrivivax sp.]
MQLPDAFAHAQGWAGLRYLQPLVLLWLAFFFGRTLRAGSTPLIERVARRSNAMLPAPLGRYTRWLTAIWCGYFVLAAVLSALLGASGGAELGRFGIAVLFGSVLLFAGEHWVRPRIFPHEVFPGLLQQLRDTWSIWRIRDGSSTPPRC